MRKELVITGLRLVQMGINQAAMVEEEVLDFLIDARLVDEINKDINGDHHIVINARGTAVLDMEDNQ